MIDNIGWITLEFHSIIFIGAIFLVLIVKLTMESFNRKNKSDKIDFASTMLSLISFAFVVISWGSMFYVDLSGQSTAHINSDSYIIADNGKIYLSVMDRAKGRYDHYVIKCKSNDSRIPLKECFELMKAKPVPELISLSKES